MEIYPALDLFDGKCVRLKKGNFENKTIYSNFPKEIVQWMSDTGAKNLHLVDLSGAKDPNQRQVRLIREIVSEFPHLFIQYGGGIRSLQEAQEMFRLGVSRIVLGSLAIQDPQLTLNIIHELGAENVTLALDVQMNEKGSMKVATDGWQKTSDQELFEVIDFYLTCGLNRILCTDIQRDGMMTGPNTSLYLELVNSYPTIQFQASGGISSLTDLQSLKPIGVHSTIIGRALYEGTLELKEVFDLC